MGAENSGKECRLSAVTADTSMSFGSDLKL